MSKATDNPLIKANEATHASKRKWDFKQAVKMRLENKLSYQQIADYFGVTKQTIFNHLKPIMLLIENKESVTHYHENKAEILNAMELQLLGSLADPDVLEKATLNNRAYAFSQVSNAKRLASGEATVIHDHAGSIKQLEAIEAKIKAEQEKLQLLDGETVTVEWEDTPTNDD